LASHILDEAGDKLYNALAFNNLADLEITRGNLSKGLHLLQQALFKWRAVGHQEKITLILTQMGRLCILEGNLLDAEGLLRAALDLPSRDHTLNPMVYYFALCNLADFERKRGNLEQALQLAREAIALLEPLGTSGTDLAYAWSMVTSILLDMKDLFQAEEALATGEDICSSLMFLEGIVNNILLRGVLELHKGNLGLAQEYLESARKRAEENKFFEVMLQTELSLADLYLSKFKLDSNKIDQKMAADYLLRASQLAEQTVLHPWKLEARILEAVAHSISLHFKEAVEILKDVESTARSLELHLIENKAKNLRIPMEDKIGEIGAPPKPDLTVDEISIYIEKAHKYVADAQVTFKGIG
jgi:tetratricopeptide (TPR) repeat protein